MPFSRAARHAPGLVLYEGPSLIDEQPIVVIATGIFNPSSNRKTGWMVQTWILRADVHPLEASKSGADRSICGSCPYRRQADGVRRCYVVLHEAPSTVFRAYRAGRYAHPTGDDLAELNALPVRAGSYGDPGAAPREVWDAVLGPHHTGYTHRWRERPDLRHLLMASVDDVAELHQARALGWRAYRVLLADEEGLRPNEVLCAHVTRGVRCEQCRLCQGAAGASPLSIAVPPHGASRHRFGLAVIPT